MGACALAGCNKAIETNGEIEKVTLDAPEEQTFSIATEDSCTIIQVVTTKEKWQFAIKEIDVIKNGAVLNSINDIVGYYDDISLDKQTSFAVINYYGRKWGDFILLDINSGQVEYYEPFNFPDIKTAYRDQGDRMVYEINENGVITFSCEKILDADTIIVGYQVDDKDGYLQSGIFKYIISKHAFEDMKQNPPKPEG
jgi:hypothetical protein